MLAHFLLSNSTRRQASIKQPERETNRDRDRQMMTLAEKAVPVPSAAPEKAVVVPAALLGACLPSAEMRGARSFFRRETSWGTVWTIFYN